jgi:hypothetical protein
MFSTEDKYLYRYRVSNPSSPFLSQSVSCLICPGSLCLMKVINYVKLVSFSLEAVITFQNCSQRYSCAVYGCKT